MVQKYIEIENFRSVVLVIGSLSMIFFFIDFQTFWGLLESRMTGVGKSKKTKFQTWSKSCLVAC